MGIINNMMDGLWKAVNFPLAAVGYSFKSPSADFNTTTPLPRAAYGPVIDYLTPEARRIVPYPTTIRDMYIVRDLCTEYTTSVVKIAETVTRNGNEWKAKFTAYCPSCVTEYTEHYNMSKCPRCAGNLLYADPQEYKMSDLFLKKNHATDIIWEGLKDLATCDDWYTIIRWHYGIDKDGNVRSKYPVSMHYAHPILMRPEADEKGRSIARYYRCPIHSEASNIAIDQEMVTKDGKVSPNDPSKYNTKTDLNPRAVDIKKHGLPRCGVCNAVMRPVSFTSSMVEAGPPEEFFLEDEVIHLHHFGRNKIWGDPPVVRCWAHIGLLIHQAIWLRDYYMERKIPGGVVIIQSGDPRGDLANWNQTMRKIRDDDQHHYPVFFMANDYMGQPGKIEFVKFMEGLKEMEYTKTRDEARRAVADLLGTKIFISGMEANSGTSGKTTKGEMEIMVTQWACESYQKTVNHWYDILIKRLGVRNWKRVLKPVEPRDELSEEDLKLKRATRASQMQTLGYNPILTPEGAFEYRKMPLWEQPVIQALQARISMASPPAMPMDGQPAEKAPPENQKQKGRPSLSKAIMGCPMWGIYDAETDELMKAAYSRQEAIESSRIIIGQPKVEIRYIFAGMTPEPNKKDTSRMGRTTTASQSVAKNSGTKGGSYVCPVCGRGFNTNQELGGHMAKGHLGPAPGSAADNVKNAQPMQSGGNGQVPDWAMQLTVEEAIQLLDELTEG